MRNSRIPLERQCPVDLQKLIIIYISSLDYILEAFKVSMSILWSNVNSLMTLAVVITSVSKTGRTDILGRTDYFVYKYSQMLYWSSKGYKYLVEMIELRPVGDL
jgi:hypothetical protein